jgi:hypothetical protein
MNTEMTQEQKARAAKINEMAQELARLLHEQAEDCYKGWFTRGTESREWFYVQRMLNVTKNTMTNTFSHCYLSKSFKELLE